MVLWYPGFGISPGKLSTLAFSGFHIVLVEMFFQYFLVWWAKSSREAEKHMCDLI
jgi:hypothetical protein